MRTTTPVRAAILVAAVLVLLFGKFSTGHYISTWVLVLLIVAFFLTKKPKV